ncbi:MAG: TcmI family type II polyketide cyclase [Angustibacter sp.]
MFSTLIVARMDPVNAASVSSIFSQFDATDMPHRMGTRRRELFRFHNLYFHLQEFQNPNGVGLIEDAKTDPRFIRVSSELRPFIDPFDPDWKSPRDAVADRFYHWRAGS